VKKEKFFCKGEKRGGQWERSRKAFSGGGERREEADWGGKFASELGGGVIGSKKKKGESSFEKGGKPGLRNTIGADGT